MLKIIRTEFFDDFKCWMDKCPDNCCDEHWNISIDDKTYQSYIAADFPDLDHKITSSDPHFLIKNHNKCPFIASNGLCTIHRDYGEEFLSNTCRSYPRFVSAYGDLYIENIGLSCPASADWIVHLDHKCQLIETIHYEKESEIGTPFPHSLAEQNMRTVLQFFYNSPSFIHALQDSYYFFDATKTLPEQNCFLNRHDLLLQNISICFLFENLMLESQSHTPDYTTILDRLWNICCVLENSYISHAPDPDSFDPALLSSILYKIMRQKDH